MVATRKSTGRNGPTSKQQTLAFNHRVTKSVPKSAKESVVSSGLKSKNLETNKIEAQAIEESVAAQNEEPATTAASVPEKTEAEIQAAKVSDAQLNRYWKAIEAARKAPRVHQQGLGVGEKVLRYFDVSSQYGPCIGMPRLRRWQRADRLGLNPPIEVLAVLLREENKGNKGIERAHMDEIMNATAVGA